MLAVTVGGVGAVLVSVRERGLPLLAGWLVLAGIAWWCAEVALGRSSASSGDTSDFRTLCLDTIGILATALVAELTLITGRLAREHEYATAWVSGGVLVALFAGTSWRSARVSELHGSSRHHTPSGDLLTAAAFVLAEACGGWLTARLALEGPLWAAWVVGSAVVVLAGAFWLSDSQSWDAEDKYLKVFGSAAVLGLVGVVAQLAVRGEIVAAWWVGGVGVGGPLLVFGVTYLVDVLQQLLHGGSRGRTVSPGAQFAGILVPLGSVAWAMWSEQPWSGPGSGDRLPEAGWLAVAAAALLVVQYGVLIWTDTAPVGYWVSRLVDEVRMGRAEFGRRDDNWVDEVSALTFSQRLTHVLQSTAVHELHRRTALTTGLAIDDIWPRIALVASDEVKRQVRRREQGVLAWRITVTSALCTTGVWLFVALTGLGSPHVDHGVAVLPVAGPLLIAAFALVQARRMLVEVYEAKADAVELYRYDLAKKLHITLPDDPSGPYMIRLAAELSGDWPLHTRGEYRREQPRLPQGAGLDELASTVARLVRSDVQAAVRQTVQEEYGSLAPRDPVRAVPLSERQLRVLAHEVSAYLTDHLTSLQRTFHEDLQSVIRSSLEQAATGAPLTNFVGYLTIELDRGAQDVRAESGTITAPVGKRVRLVVSVVRDPRAQGLASVVESRPDREFFVLESVCVEGGRDADTVSFDAMADSSTLTPQPQRRNLRVEREQQTVFTFQMPEEAGSHEVWLQLYQAGHLVQVVALKIEATETAEATDDV
ncbi:hypothetical protein [Streptomyces sp. SID12501]|uniref:Uncharacterized protein n=1 Tax=Streptomyces sp. SID12501 TaxID=2706042 RepID=A0A6B3C1B9_9ACTN|nr:hypothetical protein [Streptomyces sp. SID12501]NEC90439.1 hypothetical protein [Streptomyces sp. SID12501]